MHKAKIKFKEDVPDLYYKNDINKFVIKDDFKFKIGDVIHIKKYDNNEFYIIIECIELIDNTYAYEIIKYINEEKYENHYQVQECNLVFEFHDPNYINYYDDDMDYKLSPWRGELYNISDIYEYEDDSWVYDRNPKFTYEYKDDTLPPDTIKHIIDNYFIENMIQNGLIEKNELILSQKLSIPINEISTMIYSITDKFSMMNNIIPYKKIVSKEEITKADTKITDLEYQLINEIYNSYVSKMNGKDYFPIKTNHFDLMKIVKEAYANAKKISCIKLIQDEFNLHNSRIALFEGISKNGIMIQFWYNFDKKNIITAYPILSEKIKKKHW